MPSGRDFIQRPLVEIVFGGVSRSMDGFLLLTLNFKF